MVTVWIMSCYVFNIWFGFQPCANINNKTGTVTAPLLPASSGIPAFGVCVCPQFCLTMCNTSLASPALAGELFITEKATWEAPKIMGHGIEIESDVYVHPRTCVVVQSPSHVQLFVTPWTAACQASLFLTNSWSLPKFMPVELVMPPNHLILWCPLLLLPSIFEASGSFPVSQLYTLGG